MKKEYLDVSLSQLDSLVNKIKNKFGMEIEGYNGKKDYKTIDSIQYDDYHFYSLMNFLNLN